MPSFKFIFVIGCWIVFLSEPACFAVQSGSRGASSAGATGVPPSFSSPQTFSAPAGNVGQVFSPSAISQPPAYSAAPGAQPVPFEPSFANGSYSSQSGFQETTPAPGPSDAQLTADSGGTSGSPGIPDSSLVDPIFQISDPYSSYTVDHSAWDCFLSKYMVTGASGVNRLRYGQVSCADRQVLKCYLQQLQSVDTRTLNRNEQLAFWLNLYNARTVDIVLDNYPIRSIRQVKQKLTDFVGPFDDEGAVTVLGKPLSLNDVESGIVRPVWNDPRIHYALNCASYGCPNLSPTAWTAVDLDRRLNSAAYEYINSNRALKRGLLGVRATKIYKWYKDDFGGTDQAVLNHVRQYADGNTLNKINGRQNISGYFYDWSLNDGRILRRRVVEPVIR